MNSTKPKKKKPESNSASANSKPEAKSASPARSPRILRDETNAKLSYANFFNVSSTREETALTFGMIQASARPSEEINVKVSDRVVLTPRAAKRLKLMLEHVLAEYETRFGPLTDDQAAR